MAAFERERQVDVRAILAEAPCQDPDTLAVERLLREGAVADPPHLRAVACEASTGYKAASPDTTPPESSAMSPAPTGATFITPSDSSSR
jgi:hypothetical protein